MTHRASDAFVAATASFAAVLPLTTLLVTQEWLAPVPWLFAGIAGLGVLLRRRTPRGSVIVLCQLLATTWALLGIFAGERLWYGLPTWSAFGALGELVQNCAEVFQRYAAPVPVTRGVSFVVVAAVCLLAIAVDDIALTRRAPAAAGLPLLAVFLTAASNSGSSLAPAYFVLSALTWLVLVSRQGRWTLRRWSTTVASPSSPSVAVDAADEALGAFGRSARQLGTAALVAAVLLPAALPHMPTRFILDGLGRNDNAIGRAGRVGFNSTLDLTRSLREGSQNVVLTYRTTAPTTPPPLRVVVTSDYTPSGEWRTRPGRAADRPLLALPPWVASSVSTTRRDVSVEQNQLEAPRVAAPYPAVAADFQGVRWGVDPDTQDIYVASRASSYQVSYAELELTAEMLRTGIQGSRGVGDGPRDPQLAASLVPDQASAAFVADVANRVTKDAKTSFDAALAIQNWLRLDGGFTYSLTLAGPVTDADGREVALDPISHFLTTKQGYCVQFATAMVMMARAKGIPARMAIGFLPGTLDKGLWTVRSSDAHSWPELFFPGAGWVRFEPTPAVRSGAAPGYTATAAAVTPGLPTDGATVDQNGLPINGATTGPRPGQQSLLGLDDPALLANRPLSDRVLDWFRLPSHLVLLGLALGLLGSLVLPLTANAAARRRRRLAGSHAELAEAHWRDLSGRLADLGLPPPAGDTLRQVHRHYSREAFLDSEASAAMHRVVTTLERTRYARPGEEPLELEADVRHVGRAVAESRSRRQRLRAFLLPGEGIRWWRDRFAGVSSAPQRWWSAAARQVRGRGPRR